MNDTELREIIREEVSSVIPPTMNMQDVVRTAVQETLITLGMDVSDPLKIQQDMAFLRDLRQTHTTIRSRGMLVMVGLVVSSIAAAAWMGLKAAVQS
tara:strand:+ start:10642 stop:10932 length:291 start_codon:yes stop_codon:yes gene_type:complete